MEMLVTDFYLMSVGWHGWQVSALEDKSDEDEVEEDGGGNEQERVDAVEDAAVAGDDVAGVFDVEGALDK